MTLHLQPNCSRCVFAFIEISSKMLQIHEKEEQEMNEKNDNASCLSEEPLISADQVVKGVFLTIRLDIENMRVL